MNLVATSLDRELTDFAGLIVCHLASPDALKNLRIPGRKNNFSHSRATNCCTFLL